VHIISQQHTLLQDSTFILQCCYTCMERPLSVSSKWHNHCIGSVLASRHRDPNTNIRLGNPIIGPHTTTTCSATSNMCNSPQYRPYGILHQPSMTSTKTLLH
jgi:hypothetical protein